MIQMRINSLDYLRGLMALGIMIYHYLTWTFSPFDSDSLLGITGVYGVSIFYILSGLTLYHIYSKTLTFKNTYSFFIKRIFRILPLLWLSIALNIFLLNKSYDSLKIFLNVSGLFSFFDHDNYISTGAWSIGNEVVFYSIFPAIIILSKWKSYAVEFFFIISSCIAIYFAFFKLNSSESLGSQWSLYINPFNQMFLFNGGILIGKYFSNKKNNLVAFLLLVFCSLFLLFFPVEGNKINIVTDFNRVYFSIISFSITVAFLISDLKSLKVMDWLFSKLGHISYSVYLMHAVVFWYVNGLINRKNEPEIFLLVCVFATIIISWLSYQYFETKFITLGKRLLTRYKNNKD